MRNLAVFLLAGAMTFASNAEPASGISIDETGTLRRDGKPFRAVGVNYFSAFSRRLDDPDDMSYREGFRTLGESGIPFARFMACGFWPVDWKLYQDDPETYFAFLDDVVRAAACYPV